VALRLALLAGACLLQFATTVNLVEVYVTVTSADGEPIRDLRRDEFLVREDGVAQDVSTFAAGEFPASIALAVDRSWSMDGERLALARSAAHAFLGQLAPDDLVTILAVATETEVLSPLSTDRAEQHRAIDRLRAWGTTALHDAVIAGLDAIQPASGRRALVLLSDGDERYSRATAGQALDHARRSDVLVYPLALGSRRPALFAELAVQSGGRSFHLRDPRALRGALEQIARELRYQYFLGYSPSRPLTSGAGEWRSIHVSVTRLGVRVRARDGYTAR
jgi:Ca-activated chloride channel family protein